VAAGNDRALVRLRRRRARTFRRSLERSPGRGPQLLRSHTAEGGRDLSLPAAIDPETRDALNCAWHADSAQASLERWLQVCAQEGWGRIPEDLPLLARVFGASWYFTRFLFYRGAQAAGLFARTGRQNFARERLADRVQAARHEKDDEGALDRLRLRKNEIMLQVLIAELRGDLDQQVVEEILTDLAEVTLEAALDIYAGDLPGARTHRPAVLGMGRLAGHEMNFGSDLDLIFLYSDGSGAQQHSSRMTTLVRRLLRGIAQASAAGKLYDVDMRLRPHGTAGALVTSLRSFREYHAARRQIWERQMMTRCRLISGANGATAGAIAEVERSIYAKYDPSELRREISTMRFKVERELGNLRGKLEIKRGMGGIMDIDFIAHCLQLQYGADMPELRTPSTRAALQRLSGAGCLDRRAATELLAAYDFLKKVEARLRVFDMKPVSSFVADPAALGPLARAMGYLGAGRGGGPEGFLAEYRRITARVRQHFIEIVGTPEQFVIRDS
jgi:glutamate-ammonia-ligase adenylyltransferase